MSIGEALLLSFIIGPMLLMAFGTLYWAAYSVLGQIQKLFGLENKPVYCIDCKHLMASTSTPNWWLCAKSQYVKTHPADVVTGIGGSHSTHHETAKDERGRFGGCGPNAKRFEPKEAI